MARIQVLLLPADTAGDFSRTPYFLIVDRVQEDPSSPGAWSGIRVLTDKDGGPVAVIVCADTLDVA
jgi:hypothetical protein